MSILANARHERFAQELAKGKSATEAYAEAGYQPNRQNAARLTTNDDVASRVAELKARAAARVEISVASVTEALLRIASKGEELKEAPGLAVARASYMDAAKLNGLVVDRTEGRSEVTVHTVDRPPGETRQQWIERKRRELEDVVATARPAG